MCPFPGGDGVCMTRITDAVIVSCPVVRRVIIRSLIPSLRLSPCGCSILNLALQRGYL